MIVKFHKHGKGPASGALNYLLKEKAERPSDSPNQKRLPLEPRAHARVLSGDVVVTEQLIDATPYQQKYKSGVLSFEKRADELTEHQKFEIMQKFEDTIFCGLDRDQFDILWVEHADKDIDKTHPIGRLELNFLIAGQELRSGKRLQPFYAGADKARVNAFKNVVNYEYKLADPEAPNRKRPIKGHTKGFAPPTPYDTKAYTRKDSKKDDEVIAKPRNREALRDAINRKMKLEFDQNALKNRGSVIWMLRRWGLNIEHSRSEKSISVSSKNLVNKNGKSINLRLEGGLYEKDFNSVDYEPHIMLNKQKIYDAKTSDKFDYSVKLLSEMIEKKSEYHAELYKDVVTPEPLNLSITDIVIDNVAAQDQTHTDSLTQHLERRDQDNSPNIGY